MFVFTGGKRCQIFFQKRDDRAAGCDGVIFLVKNCSIDADRLHIGCLSADCDHNRLEAVSRSFAFDCLGSVLNFKSSITDAFRIDRTVESLGSIYGFNLCIIGKRALIGFRKLNDDDILAVRILRYGRDILRSGQSRSVNQDLVGSCRLMVDLHDRNSGLTDPGNIRGALIGGGRHGRPVGRIIRCSGYAGKGGWIIGIAVNGKIRHEADSLKTCIDKLFSAEIIQVPADRDFFQ